MKILIKYCLLIILFSPVMVCYAQKEPIITKVKKFKPPVVKTEWNNFKNGAVVSREDALQMLSLPIKITDSAKNIYKIDNYRFMYKSKNIVENDETGKKEVSSTIASGNFTTTPLPEVWLNNLKYSLKTGEELYYFDVMVKDSQGRLFSAPELKIIIQ